MGLLSGLIGNASEINVSEVEEELSHLLIENEQAEKAFRLIRDYFIFTNKRLILIDKQGLSGKKTEFYSIPYTSISHFCTITAGHFDLDSELKIWLVGHAQPFVKDFKKGSNLEAVQKAIAYYVLKST